MTPVEDSLDRCYWLFVSLAASGIPGASSRAGNSTFYTDSHGEIPDTAAIGAAVGTGSERFWRFAM